MKKNIKTDVPQVPETPVSNVRAFFTKEITEHMVNMSLKEMESVLKDMVGSRQFIAILKYSSLRMPILDATLRGTDPIKDPSRISWGQGCMAGLDDLQTYIIDLNAPKPVMDEGLERGEQPITRTEGVIVG